MLWQSDYIKPEQLPPLSFYPRLLQPGLTPNAILRYSCRFTDRGQALALQEIEGDSLFQDAFAQKPVNGDHGSALWRYITLPALSLAGIAFAAKKRKA